MITRYFYNTFLSVIYTCTIRTNVYYEFEKKDTITLSMARY